MPSSRPGTFELIVLELARALEPVTERLEHHASPMPFLAELGLALPHGVMSPALGEALHEAIDAATELPDMIQELATAIDGGNASEILDQGVALAQRVKTVVAAFDTIAAELGALGPIPGLSPADLAAFVAELPRRLLDTLLIEYLENAHPLAFAMAALVGLVEQTAQNIGSTDPLRPEHVRKSLRLDRLGSLLRSPDQVARDVYGWGEPTFDGVLPIQRLTQLLEAMGIVVTHRDPLGAPARPAIEIGLLTIAPTDGLVPPGLEATFMLDVPEGVDLELPLDDGWLAKLTARAALSASAGIQLRPPAEVTLVTSGAVQGQLSAGLVRVPIPPETGLVLLGLGGGSGLTAQRVGIGFLSSFQWNTALGRAEGDFGFEGRIQGGKLLVAADKADGFLATLLSGRALEAGFDLGFGWTAGRGVFFVGSSALEVDLPVHVNLGAIDLNAITISVGIEGDTLPIALSVSVKALLGPVTAVVEKVGAVFVLGFPDDRSGNLGLLQLDAAFKPPSGIALAVDGGGFKGGGFLRFEPEQARYSGMLELEFQDRIALKAIGLLETELPSGQDGFALLIIITAEFTPIQLGFGFTLNGVGGLLGLNRRADLERLRTGLRDNTLGSILFPQDIVENSARIISDLRQVFPVEEGRFLFGPMAKIGWGSPTIITLDLGLLIEVPHPVRLAILGVLKGILPREDAPVLRLQVNFLGEIDFEKGQLLFDASLYDSKLLAFTLTGDMAIRLFWGGDPNFLLTVGGFHPAYQPPPMRLPELRQLTLSLTDGDNPRLRLETYFAITSNTVQFGARVEVYARASSFNVYGFIAFDVLFQFSPFHFIADVSAMLALRVGSSAFASITLAFTLEGPTPWSVNGTASFKICWFFTLKVRFSKTWGEQPNEIAGDALVMPLLLAALNDPNNWSVEPPAGRHLLVSTREIVPTPGAPAAVIAQPYGVLTVSQKVVPLNLTIETFGNLPPADGTVFRIGDVRLGESTTIPNPDPAKEHFAPAQFFKKSDADKLSDKSFERYDSGIRIRENGRLKTAYAATRQVRYELSYIDSQREALASPPVSEDTFRPDATAFLAWAVHGATSKSDLSHARNRRPALAPEPVAVADERFAVVEGDLQVVEGAAGLTEAEAVARLRALQAEGRHRRLQVVPAFELATVA
ncbi:MAG TPA: DUF6603 domain-containing protein [Vicinamibacterales bacterium]|nr:DUF6603 domain-containing protein [Vicinamibacterales bacterium]